MCEIIVGQFCVAEAAEKYPFQNFFQEKETEKETVSGIQFSFEHEAIRVPETGAKRYLRYRGGSKRNAGRKPRYNH